MEKSNETISNLKKPFDSFSEIEDFFLRIIEKTEFLLLTIESDVIMEQKYSPIIHRHLQSILELLEKGKTYTQDSGKIFFIESTNEQLKNDLSNIINSIKNYFKEFEAFGVSSKIRMEKLLQRHDVLIVNQWEDLKK